MFSRAEQVLCLCVVALSIIVSKSDLSYADEQAMLEDEVERGPLNLTAREAPLAEMLRVIDENAGFAITQSASMPFVAWATLGMIVQCVCSVTSCLTIPIAQCDGRPAGHRRSNTVRPQGGFLSRL